MITIRNKQFGLLSGIVSAISFSYPILWPIGILSFSLFIYLLNNAQSQREAAYIGGIYGFAFMGGTIIWFFEIFSLTSVGISNPILSTFVVFTTWILTVCTLSLSSAIFGYCFVKLKRNVWSDVFLISILWVCSEVLRSFFFFIQTISPQSVPGINWTFGFSGYILSGSSILLQFASIGGVYLLGFIFAFLGASLVYTKLSKKRIAFIIFLTIILYLPAPSFERLNSPTINIATLKTTESSYFTSSGVDYEGRFERISELIYEISTTFDADMILLPEDTRFLKRMPIEQLSSLPIRKDSYIMDSARFDFLEGPAISQIMTYSHESGIEKHYTKILLTPENEYLSILYRLILLALGESGKITDFQNYMAYEKGVVETASYIGNIPIAASLCSEIYSPHIQRNIAKDSGVIVNLASHSRTKGPNDLFTQILAMSKVRAVENGKYLVQSINYANSFILTSTGKVVAMTNSKKPFDFVTYEVPLMYTKTIFSTAPYLIPILSFTILLFLIIRRRRE